MIYYCFWCEKKFEDNLMFSIESPFEGEPDMALCHGCGSQVMPTIVQIHEKAERDPLIHQIKRARGLITEVRITSERTDES